MVTRTFRCLHVWLCATEDPTDTCYRHYHNCWLIKGHAGRCHSTSGAEHHSGNRVGDIVTSISDAYAQMKALGWK